MPGMVLLALEGLAPLELGSVGHGQAADRGDEELRRRPAAIVCADLPAFGCLVVDRRRDPGIELDVPAKIELLGDILEILQDLRLAGESLAPGPLFEELLGEPIREHIEDALAVAPGSGIAIPVPGTTDIAARLVDPRREPEIIAQTMEHVQPREPRPDDDRVKLPDRPLTGLWMVLLQARHYFLPPFTLILVNSTRKTSHRECGASVPPRPRRPACPVPSPRTG